MNNKYFAVPRSAFSFSIFLLAASSLSACHPTPYEARKLNNIAVGGVVGAGAGAGAGVGVAALSGGALGTGAWIGGAVGIPVGLVAGAVATDIAIDNELNAVDAFIISRGQAIAVNQQQVAELRAESDGDSYLIQVDDTRARYQYVGPALGIPTRNGAR